MRGISETLEKRNAGKETIMSENLKVYTVDDLTEMLGNQQERSLLPPEEELLPVHQDRRPVPDPEKGIR
jgi:non-ribosomal peptide synthetase component E (peptide arylation enzyme)